MSVNASLYVGMSGMRVNEHTINVIGNNLANLNTIGFKSSRGTFADLLSQTLVGSNGAYQVGLGAGITGTQRVLTQGALLGTGVNTDIAIGGNGHLIVRGAVGGVEGNYYSRNGQLKIDNQGFLSTLGGLRVQGYLGLSDGTVSNSFGDLKIGGKTSPPKMTDKLTAYVNLNSETEVADASYTGTIDPDSPDEFATFSTTTTVYDSLGEGHQVEVYFVKTAEGEWDWHALAATDEITGTGEGFTQLASGQVTFDEDGLLDTSSLNSGGTVTFLGASEQSIEFDFGDPLSDGGDGSGSTGFGTASSVDFIDQDGYPPGTFQFMTVQEDGVIEGSFSNGQVMNIGQVALAKFENPTDLKSMGSNVFAATPLSGEPRIGGPQTGGRGSIYSGALEQSNVDIANEFTTMITAQRGYQAASRTITTADEMLLEAVNLKR